MKVKIPKLLRRKKLGLQLRAVPSAHLPK